MTVYEKRDFRTRKSPYGEVTIFYKDTEIGGYSIDIVRMLGIPRGVEEEAIIQNWINTQIIEEERREAWAEARTSHKKATRQAREARRTRNHLRGGKR